MTITTTRLSLLSKPSESTICVNCNGRANMRILSSGREAPQWYSMDDGNVMCKKCYSMIYYILNKKHLLNYQKVWRAMHPYYSRERYIISKQRKLENQRYVDDLIDQFIKPTPYSPDELVII
jgi:hypothetical protein